MSCFPCFRSQRSKKSKSGEFTQEVIEAAAPEPKKQRPTMAENNKNGESNGQTENKNINAQTFTFRELASATKNFRQETLLGEGGFGRVYKGTLPATGQVVAVKQLDRNGLQGNKEFLVEVLMLSQLHHDHLVKLVGYCADGDQRILVYEYMPAGSVEDHLLDIKEGKKPLDWKTRMKIAFGAAQGLEYLHDTANPPVIYRDLKSSNILLYENFHPKLSDFGLAKLSPAGDTKMHMSSRVMGTYGYCAPEYSRNGHLTVKSDVYSFGIVLLELITGRRAIDTTKPVDEQNLVSWAQPIFRDPKRFPDMADPLLNKQFPETGLNQAVAIAAMCLQEEPGARPLMSDVMTALSFLANSADAIPAAIPVVTPAPVPPPSEEKSENNGENDQEQKLSEVKNEDTESDDKDEDGSDYGDGESGRPEDANSATNSDVDSSDDYSDCSDYQETENVIDEGTKENKDEHQNSIKKNSKSGRKSSIENASSGNNSQDESSITTDRSISGSEDSVKSSSKKSPLYSLSRKSSNKSSKGEESSYKSSKKPHSKSLSSKSHRRSKKTKDVPGTLSLKKPLDARETQQVLPDAQKADIS
ncbi:hypothetical protein Ddye_005234 [Dipteronia dyeriana]|uniref:Protein kinase domain-containing protein n=1 Tax=Dipteronia dyeriana TaxID=168575 RepID=A0AAD9XGE2_9ROSI|nr:hypothetical protein Ddye_005234 [Dipteronia dyeriana]